MTNPDLILLYACRYALGRQAGAPDEIRREVMGGLPKGYLRKVMSDEIQAWLDETWHEHPNEDVWWSTLGLLTNGGET